MHEIVPVHMLFYEPVQKILLFRMKTLNGLLVSQLGLVRKKGTDVSM